VKLLFLYGPPAVGKLTVAQELATLTGFKLFHNHVTVDLALEYFDFGTPGFGRIVDSVRLTVLEVAASEGLNGVIFTFVYGAGIDDPFVDEVIQVVETHGAEVLFVRLSCDPDTLVARVVTPERERYRKLRSAEALRELMERHDLFSPVPHRESLSIDTGHATPPEAARRIAAHFGLGSDEDP
jgi:shikimate kinase